MALKLPAAVLAVALGYAVHSGYPALMCFALLAPALIVAGRSRWEALFLAVVYELAVVWDMPEAMNRFFGHFGNVTAWGVGAAGATAFLLSAPWLLFWGENLRWLRASAVVAISAVPPLGLIDFGSPLNSAGFLFPRAGLVIGLLAVLSLVSLAAALPCPKRWIFPAIALVACVPSFKATEPIAAGEWSGLVLHEVKQADPVEAFKQSQAVQQALCQSKTKYTVLPEGIAYEWTPISEVEWSSTFTTLQGQHRAVVIGAYEADAGIDQFHNEALLRGDITPTTFEQRVPVPLAMWKPFTAGGFPLRVFGPGSLVVGKERAGLLMCYEMTIPWPAIATLWEHPTHLVGMANDWWAAATPAVPRMQQANLHNWAQLVDVDETWAANLPVQECP